MVDVVYEGRMGNHLFKYFVAYLFAKKHNLNFSTDGFGINQFIKNFGLPTKVDGIVGDEFFEIYDSTYEQLYYSESVELKRYVLKNYFQLGNFFEKNKEVIRNTFNIRYQPQNKENVFVHYRIGDIGQSRSCLPYEYYQEALNLLKFSGGYVSSDSPTDERVIRLCNEFGLTTWGKNETKTLLFAKDFNNLVLSEGTYSFWIGYLSNAENIICNERDYNWHGKINQSTWKKLSWDYKNENKIPIKLK
jgi:hypothetical protein